MNVLAMLIDEIPREGLSYTVLDDADVEALTCILEAQRFYPATTMHLEDSETAQAALCAALAVPPSADPGSAVRAWMAANRDGDRALVIHLRHRVPAGLAQWLGALERARRLCSMRLFVLIALSPATRAALSGSVVIDEGTFLRAVE